VSINTKTFKRELALMMLVFLGGLAFWGNVQMVELFITPIFAFVTIAFGLDAYAKQIVGGK